MSPAPRRQSWRLAVSLLLLASASAEIDSRNFDLSVRPADNFYLFADGHWLRDNPIPADRTSWGSFAVLAERNEAHLREVCERAAREGASIGEVARKVGDFYASGMDEAALNAAGALPLQPELGRIAALHTRSDVMSELGHLAAMGISAGFDFAGEADKQDSAAQIAGLSQGGLGLPDRDYYFRDDDQARTLRGQYVDHVARTFELLGDGGETAQAEALEVMSLETALAHASVNNVALRDPYRNYHKMSEEEFTSTIAPEVDWTAFFTATGGPAFAALDCAQPDFFRNLAGLLRERPVGDWQGYLRWQLARACSPYLSDPFVNESYDFYGRKLIGQKEMKPRWKRVVETEDGVFGEALGQLYVAAYFPPEAKAKVIKLVGDLHLALRERLQTLDWMDEPTRQAALAKLAAFSMKIGYPDHWKDYRSVTINRGSYLGNVLAANAFEVRRNLRRIGGPVDRAEWQMSPPTVNAYYQPPNNEIVFPAGILQPPFFDPSVDDAVNYGAIGVVIGHEMTHGFDDQGRKYDARGDLKDWWTPDSAARFRARADKIVQQFSGYAIPGGLHLNGQLTEGENLADLGGLRLAYLALERALAGRAPPPLIDGFTAEQRFFLSYATVWRTNYRPEYLRLLVLTNPHSPGEFRANGPLSDLDEFARAYAVPDGSPMRRPAAERPAIW